MSSKNYNVFVKQTGTIPQQSKNIVVNFSMGNQYVAADSGYTMSSVTLLKPDTLIATNIKSGITIAGVTGTYTPSIDLQNKTATPLTTSQTITADSMYDGLGTVTVNAVTSSIDSNIIAGNIKTGVTILGVTGTYSGTTPSGTISITSNGTGIDVSQYQYANVNVPSFEPSGSYTITANGTYDIYNYEYAVVNVQGGGGVTQIDNPDEMYTALTNPANVGNFYLYSGTTGSSESGWWFENGNIYFNDGQDLE